MILQQCDYEILTRGVSQPATLADLDLAQWDRIVPLARVTW